MIRYFEWGDERDGKVTIWIKSKKGEVVMLGTLEKKYLPEGAIFENPYN